MYIQDSSIILYYIGNKMNIKYWIIIIFSHFWKKKRTLLSLFGDLTLFFSTFSDTTRSEYRSLSPFSSGGIWITGARNYSLQKVKKNRVFLSGFLRFTLSLPFWFSETLLAWPPQIFIINITLSIYIPATRDERPHINKKTTKRGWGRSSCLKARVCFGLTTLLTQ